MGLCATCPYKMFLVLEEVTVVNSPLSLFGIARLNLCELKFIELPALTQLLNVAVAEVKDWSPSAILDYQFKLIRSTDTGPIRSPKLP